MVTMVILILMLIALIINFIFTWREIRAINNSIDKSIASLERAKEEISTRSDFKDLMVEYREGDFNTEKEENV